MPLLILAAFIIVPLVEIAILIQVGSAIGTLPTIALVILTAVVGTIMLRAQGLKVVERAQRAVAEGRAPVETVVDGIGLLVAGALLLTPGIATDAIGFALFVPGVRRSIARWVVRNLVTKASVRMHSSTHGNPFGPGHNRNASNPRSSKRQRDDASGSGATVIDGEYAEVDNPPEPGKPRPDSPWRGDA